MCYGFVLAAPLQDIFQATSQLLYGTVQMQEIVRSRADVRQSHGCFQLRLPYLGLGKSEMM